MSCPYSYRKSLYEGKAWTLKTCQVLVHTNASGYKILSATGGEKEAYRGHVHPG